MSPPVHKVHWCVMVLDEDLNDRGLTSNHSELNRILRLLPKTLYPIRFQIRKEESDNFIVPVERRQAQGGAAPMAAYVLAGSQAEQEADERSMPVASGEGQQRKPLRIMKVNKDASVDHLWPPLVAREAGWV